MWCPGGGDRRPRPGPATAAARARRVASTAVPSPIRRRPPGLGWFAALALAAAAIVASHVVGLGTSPPGLHNDEASIAYNAWTIAHGGTDQFGVSWPLLFRDFGDYKSPVSTYPLAPFTLVFPLSATLVRMPSAVAGILLAFAAAVLAWRLTRSRTVALLVMLEAAFEPWFFHTARIDLEADLFTVLCVVVALAALAGGGARRWGSCALAGVALACAPLGAQPGRYIAAVVVLLVVATHLRATTWRHLALVAAPVAASTLVVLAGTAGAATARLSDVSVFHGRTIPAGIVAWIANYPQYLGPDFLFVHGDPNLRHSTGFMGLLFVTAVPVIAAGIVRCVRRWREPLARLALVGLLVAPLGPALTTPVSARRDIAFLPFLLIVLAHGWDALIGWLRSRRVAAGALAAATAVVASLYLADYAVAYPTRSASAFSTGVLPALLAARDAAVGHRILVSAQVPDAAEISLVAFLPQPGPGNSVAPGVDIVGTTAALAQAGAGDVVVLPGDAPPPAGFSVVTEETVTGPASLGGPSTTRALVAVYRRD